MTPVGKTPAWMNSVVPTQESRGILGQLSNWAIEPPTPPVSNPYQGNSALAIVETVAADIGFRRPCGRSHAVCRRRSLHAGRAAD
jgi:hypothetical protein